MSALSDKKLLGIYERMTEDFLSDDDPRRVGILGEMRDVIAAADSEAAGEVIAWWDDDWSGRKGARWDRSPVKWAAEYRRRAARAAKRLEGKR